MTALLHSVREILETPATTASPPKTYRLGDGAREIMVETLTETVRSRLEAAGIDDVALVPFVDGSSCERIVLYVDGAAIGQATIGADGDGVPVMNYRTFAGRTAPSDPTVPACLLDDLFSRHPKAERARLSPAVLEAFRLPRTGHGLIHGQERGHDLCIRSAFFQVPLLWLRPGLAVPHPVLPVACAHGGHHPQRAPAPKGAVYERWDPIAETRIGFRTIDRERDLDLFHAWMNETRVSFYWELDKPKDELARYLETLDRDPHAYALIGSFDGDPACYYEIYWAKEDRLGAYYDADDFDRGWHGLVGNKAHLGRRKTAAWFRALTHYLFLDDARTRKIVGEPRASHTKMLSYAEATGYDKIKEFDFPHKRAALMECRRERFFREILV